MARTGFASIVLLALLACSAPKTPPFSMPRNIEDARARFLSQIPEGREIGEARAWMRAHGFACAAPVASASGPFVHTCHPAASSPADAGWRSWTVILYEQGNRLADVSVRR